MPQLYTNSYFGVNPSQMSFYQGGSTSSLVPDTFHVAINGRPYMIDLNQPFYRQYRRQLAQLIRTQADTGTDPGDQSMDPNSLWRRSFEDWSEGAQQRYLDRPADPGTNTPGSTPNGFWQSKGIDALSNRWQINLLPDTTQLKSSANTNLRVLTVGTHIYFVDGQTVSFASSVGGSWTAVTGMPAVTISIACTDGNTIWFAVGASGIYSTTEAAASASQYTSSAIDANAVVGYCNGRLMLASTNKIYNITASGALPAALFTAGNPNMTFAGFAEGNGAIYAGASVGSRSWVYGMTVTSDGSALSAPVIQAALPNGETISSVFGELSFLMLGTSLGIRMCQTTAAGGVSLGALVTTPKPVKCIDGWRRWVYFGLSAYDTVSSGLGKLDLQNQVISGILPAFCSDLMVTSQADVISVASYQGQILFCISALGVYGPSANLVPSGQIDSGYLLYDLTDRKVACLLDIEAIHTFGSFSASLSTDTGPFTSIGLVSEGDGVFLHTFGAGPASGERFEVRLILNRHSTDNTKGPQVNRWTLRAYPAPNRPLTWQLPLILAETVTNVSGADIPFDPLVELQALETMASAGQMFVFQEGRLSQPVFVQDVEFLPSYTTENTGNSYFNGLCLVTLVGLPVAV